MTENKKNYTTKTTKAEIAKQQKENKEKSTALAKIKAYARNTDIQERFANLLGSKDGKSYVESVIIAVANNDELQKCNPVSIMTSAMRAASLRLSVDPALKQAHLVPFNKRATLIVDYHGLVQLTTSTGNYKVPPHVSPVYEGEIIEVDRFSGIVDISGEKTSDKVIGWCGYFQDIYNAERYLYMTNEECDAHGKKYNPGGFNSKKSAWATDRDKMRRKTVLRQLVSRWGYFSPSHRGAIFDEEPEVIDAETQDMPDPDDIEVPEREPMTEEQALIDLGVN